MCTFADYSRLRLDEYSRITLDAELGLWHKFYLPIPQGRMVIDLGAECGCTANFYLLHGASAVVAVEEDASRFEMLKQNFAGDTRVIPIHGSIGHVKMDIEGAEKGSVLAVHRPLALHEVYVLHGIEHIFKPE